MTCIENKEERGRENLGFCGWRENKKVKRTPMGYSNEKYGKRFILVVVRGSMCNDPIIIIIISKY